MAERPFERNVWRSEFMREQPKRSVLEIPVMRRLAGLARQRVVKLAGKARHTGRLLCVSRSLAYSCLATLAAVGFLSFLLLLYLFPSPPSRIVITSAATGTSYEQIARRYAEILARSHVAVEVRETTGSLENIDLLRTPTSGVDVAFMSGAVVHAHKGRQIWSLGTIFHSPI